MSEPDLAAFARWVVEQSRDGGGANGADIQDAAVWLGILVEVEAVEPCCEECPCAEVSDFPQTCYRLHPSLVGEPPAGREVVE